MYQPKFPEFWVGWKVPYMSLNSIVLEPAITAHKDPNPLYDLLSAYAQTSEADILRLELYRRPFFF